MNIVITGGSSGLGACLIEKMQSKKLIQVNKIFNLDIKSQPRKHNGVIDIHCDVTSQDQVKLAVKEISKFHGGANILINCAAINWINYLEDADEFHFDMVMRTNCYSIYNTSKAFLPLLQESGGTILNIVSNASHMPMTSSLAYNASKGAAHIMTLQLARELTKRHDITVFGISPNKLAGTGMSEYIDKRVPEVRGWSEEEAKQYQLNSLLTGEETDPNLLAEFICFLLSSKERHKFLTGCVIPYGA